MPDKNSSLSPDTCHVSGTSLLKTTTKQRSNRSSAHDCNPRVSPIKVSDHGLTISESTKNRHLICNPKVSPKRPQGLWRRGATYQYRVRVPHDLVGLVGLVRINRSLKTTSFHDALRAARRVAYEIELEFEQARRGERTSGVVGEHTRTVHLSIVSVIAPEPACRTLKDAIDGYMADPTRSRTAKSEAVYRKTFDPRRCHFGGRHVSQRHGSR
ncbi:DUF6538 domain-containing protein [Sphingobium bisphenolivorans]|uniref:DUF6538 domain-containing protein n=1 Tax=Sphingobium bisphenolivorans TaxID=1335760 RepID=UPI003B75BBDB